MFLLKAPKKRITFFPVLIFTLTMGSWQLPAVTSDPSSLDFGEFSSSGRNGKADPFEGVFSQTIRPPEAFGRISLPDTLINAKVPRGGAGAIAPMENGELAERQLTAEQKQELAEFDQMQAERIQQERLDLEQRKQAELQAIQSGMANTSNQGVMSQTMMSAGLPTQAEYDALMDFYQATDGANWINNTGWSSANPNVIQDVSGFYGVHTNANGNVTGIFLSTNEVSGFIPESISSLVYLEYLDLSVNTLATIPEGIGGLISLKSLYLNSSRINWTPVPESIVNLVNLEYLNIHSNYLTGPIPADIGNLTKLNVLALFFTKLEGNLPSSIGNLHDLEWLELMGAEFTGPIPASFSNLTKLYHFRVYNNQLTGPVPDYFCSFPNLLNLSLYGNQFTGTLPPCIYTSGINHVYLANNNFSVESIVEMAPYFPNQADFLPQNASMDTVYMSVTAGDFLVLNTDLSINTPGVSEYRWVKNGVPLFPNFQQNAFEFTDTSFSCEYYPGGNSGPNSCNGVYYVEIQNSQLPVGTILKGPPTVVKTISETLDRTICLLE